MNTQKDIYPETNCLALTVNKEHILMLIHRVRKTTIRVSLKTLLYAIFLTVLNIII